MSAIFDYIGQNPGLFLAASLLLMLAALIFITTFFVQMTIGRKRAISDRMTLLLETADTPKFEDIEVVTEDTDQNSNGKSPWIVALQKYLLTAGGTVALRTAIPLALSASLFMFFILSWFFEFSAPISVILAIIVFFFTFRNAIIAKRVRRKLAFLDNLPDAIELIIRAAQAGIPISEAIATAGNEINEPVRSEFARISNKIRLGVDMKDAMNEAADRIQLPDFDFFVVALLVQRETGGQLAETLQNLATILRRRKEMRMKIKALTAEGRMSSKVVSALPFVTSVLITLLSPEYMKPLFYDANGRHYLLIAIVILSFGMFVIGKITQGES